jgi:hypothetical protein
MLFDEVEGKKMIMNEKDERVKIGNLYQVFSLVSEIIVLSPYVYQLDSINKKNGCFISFSLSLMNDEKCNTIIESKYLYEINC